MSTIASLNVAVTANTAQFATGMKGAASATTLLGRAAAGATGFVHGLATAFLPLAGIGATVAALRGVEGFGEAMARSTSILKLTGDQAERLEGAVKSAAAGTALSATDVAASVGNLAAAGFTAEQAIGALPVVTKFAQAAAIDTGAAVTYLADSLNALGLKTGDAIVDQQRLIAIGDKLVNANLMANASVDAFAAALTNKAAAAGNLLGQSIDDVIGVLAVLAEKGFAKGEAAGTTYEIMLRELSVRAIENAGAWKELGVAAFDSQGNLLAVPAILRDLTGLLSGMSDEQQQTTLSQLGFQLRSQSVIKALLGTSDAMEDFTRRSKEAGGVKRRSSPRLPTRSALVPSGRQAA